MALSLRDILRWLYSPRKERSVFASEQEAYDFVQKVYKETGGVTPELRRAYEFYQKSMNDDGSPEVHPPKSDPKAHSL